MADLWPHGTPHDTISDLGEQVARRYQVISDRLDRKIRELASKGKTEDVLEQLRIRQRLVDELREYTERQLKAVDPKVLAEQVTSQAAAGSAAAVSRVFSDVPRLRSYSAIGSTNISAAGLSAVSAIEFDLRNTFTALNSRILRDSQDIYQSITSEYASLVVSGVETRRALRKEILQKYLSQGVGSYVDATGRHWPIDVYSEMTTRTAASRAWREQSVVSMESRGIELMSPVGGRTSCEICGKWQGKVVSRTYTSGSVVQVLNARTGVPVDVTVDASLEEMRADGWGHPNCRCVFIPHIPGSGIEPSDFTTRDPAAEADRARERKLRRELRVARETGDTDKAREIRKDLKDVRERIDKRKTDYANRPNQTQTANTTDYASKLSELQDEVLKHQKSGLMDGEYEWLSAPGRESLRDSTLWESQNRRLQDQYFRGPGIQHPEVLSEYFNNDGSFEINRRMRSGMSSGVDNLEDVFNGWRLPEPTTTYRGVWDMDLPDDLVGALWEDKGFQSTTFNRSRAEYWASSRGQDVTMFEITSPTGTRVALDSVQEELALAAGSKIRIVSDTWTTLPGTDRRMRLLRGYVEQ